MGAKHELLTEAEAAYTELREAVESVPDARMTEVWPRPLPRARRADPRGARALS